jgi:hypothetical protein
VQFSVYLAMVIKDKRLFRSKVPNGRRTIWRYMNLEKFLDLLLNSRIFFTNLARLTDKYEGTIFDSNIRIANSYANKLKDSEVVKKEIVLEQQEVNNLRNYTLVNCWSLKRHESFALWKIYVDNSPGVAIKATISDLKKSINLAHQDFDEDISIAEVKYQDILDDSFSRIEATITKKKFYDFENELRMIILNFPLSNGGYEVPYDITIGRYINVRTNVLLKEIYISPFLNSSYRNTISQTLITLAPFLKNRIKESKISEE